MREETLKGLPNTYELGWLDWTCPRGSLLGFSPISPATGVDALKQYEMVTKRFREFGFDYMGTFVVGWRELHHIGRFLALMPYLDKLFSFLVQKRFCYPAIGSKLSRF
jgi:hypothetical protein